MEKITGNTKDEFQRVNSYLDANHKLITLLLEDSMINQLLLEQDIVDRKSIALFGVKKNSEILGTNQGAVNNNYARSSQNFYDRKYSEVVNQSELKNSKLKL